jgi:DNA repair exonuclease SbcCD ATPase subunit
MVDLTREQRRRRVLELHNHGMGTREIAGILHMSFTDIGKFLKDADKEKEAEQQRTRQEFLSSRAYKLFSDGKSPVQVAIDLNIRASEAIVFQREYWELEGLHNLDQIYQEIKCETWHLVNLYRSVKDAGMGVQHVLTLLRVANNDLPTLEYRHETLKQEVNSLHERKRKLYNQVTEEGSNLEYYRVACQREIANLKNLQQRRIRDEALVRDFQNNNAEYVKITKTVEETVRAALSNGKALLKLALFCLIESIKENPEKYSPLVYENMPQMTSHLMPYYAHYSYSQQQSQPIYFDTKARLVEEAEKMYDKLAKDLVDEILSGYTVGTSRTSLPMFIPSDDPNEGAAEERNTE